MRFRSILLILLSGNVLVTGANLIRDVVLASSFGASIESDIIFLAISIPLFLIAVGANAFRTVTVPAIGKALSISEATCRSISRRFLLTGNIVTVLATLLLGIVALGLYALEIAGVDPASRQLFALFLAAILPMYLCAALIELWQGPFQAWGEFLGPTLLKLGLPVGIAVGALVLPGFSIFGVALGGAAAGLLSLLAGLALLARHDILPRRPTPPLPVDVRQTAMSNYMALVAATCITYANPLVDQWMAGLTGTGGISMLGYAGRLTTGIVTLVAGSLSQALLVHYSRQVSQGDSPGIQDTYRTLLKAAPWLGCFATISVWLLSDLGISLLYERGNFDAATSSRVATLVDLYALQFPIYWTAVAAFTLVWATSMNRVFLRIGVVLFIVNAVSDLLLIRLFGLNGIPLTTSIVFGLSGVLLHLALRDAGVVALAARDLRAMCVPFVLLGLCGLAIQEFGITLSPDVSPAILATGLLMLLGFGGLGTAMAYRALTNTGIATRAAP